MYKKVLFSLCSPAFAQSTVYHNRPIKRIFIDCHESWALCFVHLPQEIGVLYKILDIFCTFIAKNPFFVQEP